MKAKSFVIVAATLLVLLPAATALACDCGKKAGVGNQTAACQQQCGGGCGASASACSEGPMLLAQGTAGQATQEAAAAPVEVGNQHCPVSGAKVGEMGKVVPYEYNGKIYNLCCPGCVKEFQKDPEKYSKLAEEDAAREKAAAPAPAGHEEEGGGSEDTAGQGHAGHQH